MNRFLDTPTAITPIKACLLEENEWVAFIVEGGIYLWDSNKKRLYDTKGKNKLIPKRAKKQLLRLPVNSEFVVAVNKSGMGLLDVRKHKGEWVGNQYFYRRKEVLDKYWVFVPMHTNDRYRLILEISRSLEECTSVLFMHKESIIIGGTEASCINYKQRIVRWRKV